MKVLTVLVLFNTICFNAQAQDSLLGVDTRGLYDVVAPSVFGEPAQKVVGQIYYDTDDDVFKGVNQDGASVNFGIPGTANAVSSDGSSERIERLKVSTVCAVSNGSDCTIASQSGNWANRVEKTGTGQYTVHFNTGIFSASPSCVVWAADGTNNIGYSNGSSINTNNTSFSFATATQSSPYNSAFNIICMGPR